LKNKFIITLFIIFINMTDFTTKEMIIGTSSIVVMSGLGIMATRFHVCKPEQIMVRTGMGIKNLKISKKGFQWPFQNVSMISMTPTTHVYDLHNMSKERVEFNLPIVFTTAPEHPDYDYDSFVRYALTLNDMSEDEFKNTLAGIIEGEVRIHTATLTIDEMFSNKEQFQSKVTEKISTDLAKLGVRIINANIREMSDYDEKNKFFEYRRQRAVETANFEAQRDVAHAQKEGEIGIKTHETERRITIAKLDNEAVVQENIRQGEIAKSKAVLSEIEAESRKRIEIADIVSTVAAREEKAKLEQALFVNLQAQQLEEQRSQNLIQIKVNAESTVIESEGKAKSIIIESDAELYKEQQRAKGIEQILQAQANGLGMLYKSCGNDGSLLQFYMALDKQLYPQLAQSGADAVKGMNPKINIWNTGDTKANPMNDIIGNVQKLSPLLFSLQDQGKVTMPDWMPKVDVKDEK